MSQVEPSPVLALRGSFGIVFKSGHPLNQTLENYPNEEGVNCRALEFSKDGMICAQCNGRSLKVIDMRNGSLIMEIDKPRTSMLSFAPLGKTLVTCENFTGPECGPNLHIWDLETKTCKASLIQKKQLNWAPQWSDDESIFSIIINGNINFYQNHNFETVSGKIKDLKVSSFALAPGPSPHHVAIYVPGIKSMPAYVRMFREPFTKELTQPINQRNFFKSDRADLLWNDAGTALLVLTTTDVDNEGTSYYGQQGLFYLDTKGDSFIIQLAKEGPIHDVKWSPKNKEFCVIYGFMPSKATLFNHKGDSVFEFGTESRNSIYFSPLGDKLVLGGFGNLRGRLEVWDMNTRKLISQWEASDTTYLNWHPSGQYILTATTAPRLRMGNGYKIWHYTGSLLFENFNFKDTELWSIQVQPLNPKLFREVSTNHHVALPGIKSVQPTASKQVYRPPSARGKPSSFSLHELDDSTPTPQNASKMALKNRKKRESKKTRSNDETPEEHDNEYTYIAPKQIPGLTGDPEKDKKIRALTRKLNQITKLKTQKESGVLLEANQVAKINTESALISELEGLRLGS